MCISVEWHTQFFGNILIGSLKVFMPSVCTVHRLSIHPSIRSFYLMQSCRRSPAWMVSYTGLVHTQMMLQLTHCKLQMNTVSCVFACC